MRRTTRVFAAMGPTERLGRAIAAMPAGVQQVLVDVAAREDMPLVAGSWGDDGSGCLVANAVACVATPDDTRTLDLRMLDAFPQMSSRDLNTLIVAWDEATAQADAGDDAAMRALLRKGLAWARIPSAQVSPRMPAWADADTATPAPPAGGAGVPADRLSPV